MTWYNRSCDVYTAPVFHRIHRAGHWMPSFGGCSHCGHCSSAVPWAPVVETHSSSHSLSLTLTHTTHTHIPHTLHSLTLTHTDTHTLTLIYKLYRLKQVNTRWSSRKVSEIQKCNDKVENGTFFHSPTPSSILPLSSFFLSSLFPPSFLLPSLPLPFLKLYSILVLVQSSQGPEVQGPKPMILCWDPLVLSLKVHWTLGSHWELFMHVCTMNSSKICA